MKTSREEVYKAIDSEREYQDRVWRDAPTTYRGEHEVGAFLTMFDHYLFLAKKAWSENDGDSEALEVIRKLAGIAVNCMEQHGAPHR
jgi:hypothetical protein